MGLSAIFLDVSRTGDSSSTASTSEFRRLRVKVTCFGGTTDSFGLYLGSDVARLSRGLTTVALCTVIDEGFRAEVGDGVELSVFAVELGWVTFAVVGGDLRLGDSFTSFIVANLVEDAVPVGVRRASFAFSLLPNTSAIALDTDS